MLKKFTFIMVLFALALGVLVVPATATYAAESPSTEYYNAQYDYSYEETVMPTNQIVRKYEKPTASVFSRSAETNSTEKTKAILASLGMGEDFIDALSTEQLNEYANSKSIETTVSYIEMDADGTISYISEEEATSSVTGVGPGTFPIDIGGIGGVGGGDDEDEENTPPEGAIVTETEESVEEPGLRQNPVLKLVLTIFNKGGYTYHYSSDAEWIDGYMEERHYESLSIAMTHTTVVSISASGWFSYGYCDTQSGEAVYDEEKVIFSNSDDDDNNNVSVGENGGRYAVGIKFCYPEDTGYLTHYWMKAHIETDAYVIYPNEPANFHVATTYCHTVDYVTATPTLSFTAALPLDFELGFGLDFGTEVEVRWIHTSTLDPISYIPGE